jgi:hypothetical protein
MKDFQCGNCGQIIEASQGVSKPLNCPRRGAPATMIHRLNEGSFGGKRGGGPPGQGSPQ